MKKDSNGNFYLIDDNGNLVRIRVAAAGDTNNDGLKNCYVCARNGWPHESITFDKVNGRVLSDGTNEAASWKLKDYFTGRIHEHKQQERGVA